MKIDGKPTRTIWLEADGKSVGIIDQTRLPHRFVTARLANLADAARAIQSMQVRGAPLIGAPAAYGIALAVAEDPSDESIEHAAATLAATRPTAVNLAWALQRMRRVLEENLALDAERLFKRMRDEAIAVCREDVEANRALGRFGGIHRRFEIKGEAAGRIVLDDYAHHPEELRATLAAARAAFKRRIVAVFQPHRYTRLRDAFEQFSTCLNDADVAVIAPVYPAGEMPIEGIDRDTYAESLRAHGHRNVRTIEGAEDLAKIAAEFAKPGGAIVCLGAGSITHWAHGLEAALKAGEGKA